MPPYEMLTKDWLKQILKGEKKFMKMSELRAVNVVKYDELSVKKLYDELLELEGMKKYFPDKYPKGRVCDRDYMFNIANTLHPDVVRDLTKHALMQRHAVTSENMKEETIEVTPEIKQELMLLPIVKKVGSTQKISDICSARSS